MKTILVDGHLGKDAELRITSNGKKCVSFTFANNSRVKNVDKTTWYDVSCFVQNTVENQLEYLKKGKYIFITGRYDTKAYVAKDGTMKVSESIIADRIDFITTGQKYENNNTQRNTEEEEEATTGYMPSSQPVEETTASAVAYATSASMASPTDEGDEELPF